MVLASRPRRLACHIPGRTWLHAAALFRIDHISTRIALHTQGRTSLARGYHARRRSTSRPKFLRHLGRADRCAHLCEETLSLTKLVQAVGFVARQPCQFGALETYVRFESACACVLDQSECAFQCG